LLFVGLLPGAPETKPTFWQMMAQWDGEWYLRIARDGYQWFGPATQSTVGFFPLYPVLGRCAGWLLGDLNLGFLLITNGSVALYLWFLYQLVIMEGNRDLAERALIYVASFPAALVFASFYSDATALACITGAMLYSRRGRFVLAIPLAFLAGLTRLTALAVIFPVAYEMWRQRGLHRSLMALGFMPLGTLGFGAYLWQLTGDPLAYFAVQRTAWFHVFTPPWETLRLALDRASWPLTHFVTAVALLETGSILLFIILTLGIIRTRPLGDWLYGLSILLFVLIQTVDVTKGPPTESAPRYLMTIVPGFIVLAQAGKNRYLDQSVRWTFAMLQGVFAMCFFSRLWVA
jgi:hypothetical protein